MAVFLHQGDIPSDFLRGTALAVDTETMGLKSGRDRLCLVQISWGDGDAHLIQISKDTPYAPNLCALLSDPEILKLFHFARFDLSALKSGLGVSCTPVYCTKIASFLVRTYADRHGLRDLCREILGIDLNKNQQSSDWGASVLSEEQKLYAAGDVLHLHALKVRLDDMLAREGRQEIAQKCFDFLPVRAQLDAMGWDNQDIFAHVLG